MTETPNFGLDIVEQNDIVNPLTIDNGNYRKIDEAMKENQDCSVCTATELKTGTIHAITRDTNKEDTSMFRFTATSNYNNGDTFTVDEVPVTATLPDGTGLPEGAFRVNGTVLCSLVGNLLTVYTNKQIELSPSVIEQYIYPTIADLIYPVGAIYVSTNSTTPDNLFGGTWVQIKDSFLLACGDTYTSGSTGGSSSVTLTESQIPSHSHTIPSLSGSTSSDGNHRHNEGWGLVGGGNSARGTGGNFSTGQGEVTDYQGYHSHSVTTLASSTGNTGSGNAHDNMPPYLAVYVWRRTA